MMRLPVAAHDPSPDGFTWTLDGELVMVTFQCQGHNCGCGRAFTGLDSHKSTTRAVVREVPFDLCQLRSAVKEWLISSHWLSQPDSLSPEDVALLADVCAEMVEIGEMFTEGTALARTVNDVFPVATGTVY